MKNLEGLVINLISTIGSAVVVPNYGPNGNVRDYQLTSYSTTDLTDSIETAIEWELLRSMDNGLFCVNTSKLLKNGVITLDDLIGVGDYEVSTLTLTENLIIKLVSKDKLSQFFNIFKQRDGEIVELMLKYGTLKDHLKWFKYYGYFSSNNISEDSYTQEYKIEFAKKNIEYIKPHIDLLLDDKNTKYLSEAFFELLTLKQKAENTSLTREFILENFEAIDEYFKQNKAYQKSGIYEDNTAWYNQNKVEELRQLKDKLTGFCSTNQSVLDILPLIRAGVLY